MRTPCTPEITPMTTAFSIAVPRSEDEATDCTEPSYTYKRDFRAESKPESRDNGRLS